MNKSLLEARSISVRRGSFEILRDSSLHLRAGELMAVVGPSGVGKSTLLGALCGEDSVETGSVRLLGRCLTRWSPRELARQRSVLPQASRLNFPFPVVEVVAMGRTPYHQGKESKLDRIVAMDALALAGVEHLAQRDYSVLSGGERQRVQFARVLAQVGPERSDQRLLFLDEPTSHLDIAHSWAILTVARELTHRGVGVLCVLHDLNLATQFADQVAVMAHGTIVAVGTPRNVLTPSRISEVFGVDVELLEHPTQSYPIIAVSGATGELRA